MTRIVLVGAGSAEFTRELLSDFLRFPELAGAEFVLHDIDPGRLAVGETIARRMADQLGVRPVVRALADRRAALAGADVVVNVVQVGGYAATVADFEIPARYGLRQTIADTIGIGGIFRHLRTVPFLDALAADMTEVCPQAWLLNYTNPMSMNVAYLARTAPALKVAGMCHSVYWTVRGLSELLGLRYEDVTHRTAGVNHQAWLLDWRHDGRDLYPELDARIAADEQLRRRVRVDVYRRFGYYPTETSEHSSEYLPWYLRHDREIERLRIPVGDYLRISADNLAEIERTRRALAAGEPLALSEATEYAPQVVHSLVTGIRREIVVTTPNAVPGAVPAGGRLIPELPAEAAVEVPCLVDGDGLHPQAVTDLPPQCAALNRTFLGPALLAVEAAVRNDPRLVRQAAMLDPNTAATLTVDRIWSLADELTAAHGDLLPPALRASCAA